MMALAENASNFASDQNKDYLFEFASSKREHIDYSETIGLLSDINIIKCNMENYLDITKVSKTIQDNIIAIEEYKNIPIIFKWACLANHYINTHKIASLVAKLAGKLSPLYNKKIIKSAIYHTLHGRIIASGLMRKTYNPKIFINIHNNFIDQTENKEPLFGFNQQKIDSLSNMPAFYFKETLEITFERNELDDKPSLLIEGVLSKDMTKKIADDLIQKIGRAGEKL